MKMPSLPLAWPGPCLARVELFGHAVYPAALCVPVILMRVDLIAVVRVKEVHTWLDIDDTQPAPQTLEVVYVGQSAIYRITPIVRDEFAAIVGEDAMPLFEAIIKDGKVFDGELIGRSITATP